MFVLNIGILLYLILFPGILIYGLCFKNEHKNGYHVLHLVAHVFLFGVLSTGLIAFSLLALNIYTLNILLISSVPFNIALVVLARFRANFKRTLSGIKLGNKYVLLLIIGSFLLAGIIYQTPNESVIPMGMDESGYILKAFHFMNNGSLLLDDIPQVMFGEYFPEAQFANVNYYFSLIPELNAYELAFYSLLSVIYAIVLELFGLEAILRVGFIYALVSAVFFFLIIEKIFKRPIISSFGFLVFLFSPILLHFSRMTLTEIFYLMVLMGGTSMLIDALEETVIDIFVVASFILASLTLIRPDFIINYAGLGLLLFLDYAKRTPIYPRRQFLVFGMAYLSLSFIFFSLMVLFRGGYTAHLGNVQVIQATMLAAVVVYALFNINRIRKLVERVKKTTFVEKTLDSGVLYKWSAILLIGFICFTIFIRIIFSTQAYGTIVNFVGNISGLHLLFPFRIRLGLIPLIIFITYIPILISTLGTIGIYKALRNKSIEYLVYMSPFILAMITVLYSFRHSYIIHYASRRYLSGTFPLFVFGAVVVFAIIINTVDVKKWKKYMLVFLIIGNLMFNSYQVLFRNGIHFSGNAESLQSFATHFDDDYMAVFNGTSSFVRGLHLALFHYYEIDSVAPRFEYVDSADFINLHRSMESQGRPLRIVDSDNYTLFRLKESFQVDREVASFIYSTYVHGRAVPAQVDVNIVTILSDDPTDLILPDLIAQIPQDTTYDVEFHIDQVSNRGEHLQFNGWAVKLLADMLDYETFILLESESGHQQVFSSFVMPRRDVAAHFGEESGQNLVQTGFDSFVSNDVMHAEQYTISVLMRNIHTGEVFRSEHTRSLAYEDGEFVLLVQ